MRITTAHRYYGVSAGNNGIVIETDRHLIDLSLQVPLGYRRRTFQPISLR